MLPTYNIYYAKSILVGDDSAGPKRVGMIVALGSTLLE